jgi:transcriptional regulator with XRE-family HTH domain
MSSPSELAAHRFALCIDPRYLPRHGDGMHTTAVGDAIRSARRRLAMSQRAYARHLGISPTRLARLEVDARRQPLELVAKVLEQGGFQLTVVPVADEKDPDSSSDRDEPSRVELLDAAGRRLPAHCAPYRLATPHLWWFVRNGGWLTRAVPPTWSYLCPARSRMKGRGTVRDAGA